MMEKVPMTAAGHTSLEVELKRRQSVDRPRIIEHIAEARSHGDLSENAEYHAAKEDQSHNEGRIAELEDKLARAEIMDLHHLAARARFDRQSQRHHRRGDGAGRRQVLRDRQGGVALAFLGYTEF
jgi:transcription elongation GreA/GreB family factor